MFYAMPWINSTQSCDPQDDRHTGYERQWRNKGVGGWGGGAVISLANVFLLHQ